MVISNKKFKMDKRISRREALKRIGLSALSIISPFVGSSSTIELDNIHKDIEAIKGDNSNSQKSYNSYSSYSNYVNYQNYYNYRRYFNYANYGSYCSLYNPYPEN